MTNVNYLVGTFQRNGNKITNTEGLKLLIASRTATTTKKTQYFLLDKSSSPKGVYISSLYDNGNSTYKFDFKGAKYVLKLNDEDAEIYNLTV